MNGRMNQRRRTLPASAAVAMVTSVHNRHAGRGERERERERGTDGSGGDRAAEGES